MSKHQLAEKMIDRMLGESVAGVVDLAAAHAGEGRLKSSAILALQDARALLARGDEKAAYKRAMDSLDFSVGRLHPDYHRAIMMKESRTPNAESAVSKMLGESPEADKIHSAVMSILDTFGSKQPNDQQAKQAMVAAGFNRDELYNLMPKFWGDYNSSYQDSNFDDESAPKGWEPTVKAMKKHSEIDNPFALANYMKDKGYQSHK